MSGALVFEHAMEKEDEEWRRRRWCMFITQQEHWFHPCRSVSITTKRDRGREGGREGRKEGGKAVFPSVSA